MKINKWLLFGFLIFLFQACANKDLDVIPDQNDNMMLSYVAKGEVLPPGVERLENPYSVDNMLKAYADLVTNGDISKAKEKSGIKTTHYYVKFMPKMKKIWMFFRKTVL